MNQKEMFVFIESIPKKNPYDFIAKEIQTGRHLDKTAKKEIIQIIDTLIINGRFGKALPIYVFALISTSLKIMEDSNFLELLNPYGKRKNIEKMSKMANDLSELFGIWKSINLQLYYKNVSNYLLCCRKVEKKRLDFKKEIFNSSKRTIYGSLGIANTAFLLDKHEMNQFSEEKWKIFNEFTREEIANGASYVLGEFFESGLEIPLYDPSVKIKMNNEIFSIVRTAIMLSKIKEMAPEVIRLYYNFSITDDGYEISPPNDQFGAANKLADFKNATIHWSYFQTGKSLKIQSLYKYVLAWDKKVGSAVTEVKGSFPNERVVVTVTEDLKDVVNEILGDERLYHEEFIEMAAACGDHAASMDQILDFEILDNFDLRKFYQMHRYIRFFSYIKRSKMLELFNNDERIYCNSLLSCVPKEQFITNLKNVGFTNEDVENYLHVLSFDGKKGTCKNNKKEDKAFRDVQYSSIMWNEGFYIFPNDLTTNSNVFRNVFYSLGVRLKSNSMEDHMMKLLVESFTDKVEIVKPDLGYKFKKSESDVDLFVKIKDTLYLFELKNCLYPATSYEHRTLFDVIVKASDQLDTHLQNFADKEFFVHFMEKHSLDIKFDEIKTVKTSIVLSNRFYSGIKYGKHSVRHYLEFRNLIDSGSLNLGSSVSGKEYELPMCETGVFSKNDLDLYLSDNYKFYKAAWDAMFKIHKPMSCGNFVLKRVSYEIDELKYLKNVGAPEEMINKYLKQLNELKSI